MATDLSITSLALCAPGAPLPPPPPGFHRRAALLGSLAALLAAPALEAAVPATNPDAELIRLCALLNVTEQEINESEEMQEDDSPLWQRYLATDKQLEGLRASTIAGVLAKARVAQFQATQPDGSLDYSTSFTGDWPQQVIEDLLRLHGGLA